MQEQKLHSITKVEDNNVKPPYSQPPCCAKPFWERCDIQIWNESNLDTMERMLDNSIDLTVTSPPYDNLRDYKGYSFEFEEVAKELYRVTKPGGVVVWVVGDATVNGSESGTSFRQALYFMQMEFKLHDTMIWNKGKFSAVGALKTRYCPVFEYMFVFTKGKIKTFTPIKDRLNITAGAKISGNIRQVNGEFKPKASLGNITPDYGQRFNIWEICPEQENGTNHPAIFPEQLAADHIRSWSNEGDLVYEPFGGSGTVAKMCHLMNRKCIMSEISKEYCELSVKRLLPYVSQTILFV